MSWYLIKCHTLTTCGEVEVQDHTFLTLALNVGEWLVSCPGCIIPREKGPSVTWTGECLGLRSTVDMVAKRTAFVRNQTPVVHPIA